MPPRRTARPAGHPAPSCRIPARLARAWHNAQPMPRPMARPLHHAPGVPAGWHGTCTMHAPCHKPGHHKLGHDSHGHNSCAYYKLVYHKLAYHELVYHSWGPLFLGRSASWTPRGAGPRRTRGMLCLDPSTQDRKLRLAHFGTPGPRSGPSHTTAQPTPPPLQSLAQQQGIVRLGRNWHSHPESPFAMVCPVDEILTELVLGSARGKRAAQVDYEVVRELNESDLEALLNPPPMGTTAPAIKQLRHAHHSLARLLAEGRSQVEASYITGYSQSWISTLGVDPAFKELVEYYKTQKDQVYLDVHQRLAALGIATIEELQSRIDETPEGFTKRELMELAELTLDRSVAPPKGRAGAQPQGAAPAEIRITFVQPVQATIELDQGPGQGKLIEHEPGARRESDQ